MFKLSINFFNLATACFIFSPTALIAQNRILNPEPVANAQFGRALAIDGNWLMIGVPNAQVSGNAVGAVYAFEWVNSTYVQRAKLVASDGGAGDQFGSAIDLSGNTVVIGAGFDNTASGTGAGSAYVFDRVGSEWQQRAKLSAPSAATGDYFGASVGISGDTIVIGAPLDDVTAVGQNAGSAHVFRRNAAVWTHTNQLLANDGSQFQSFGAAVAIFGNQVLVGATGEDSAAGAAYAFDSSGNVSFIGKIVANDRVAGDNFGASIAIDNATAIIGAPLHSNNDGNRGAAYVYILTAGSWNQQSKLTNPTLQLSTRFGTSVAVSSNFAIVGAPLAALVVDGCAQQCGTAFGFRRKGSIWNADVRMNTTPSEPFEALGSAVAIGPTVAAIGAPLFNNPAPALSDAGSVAQFELSFFQDGFE